MKFITELKPNEVIVVGTNSTGFHGAGLAGFAFRGESRNNWREDAFFLRAMKAPVGHPDRIGKWAVFGVSRGLQQGREGASYGIETIKRGGLRRSTPPSEIKQQFVGLFKRAIEDPHRQYLMTPVGTQLAGYSSLEIQAIWDEVAVECDGIPANVVTCKF